MNRAYRRRHKKKNRFYKETNRQRAERIVSTGIATADDLKKEYDTGYRVAMKSMEEYIVPFFFAAMCCALKKTHKFGQERLVRTISATISTMNEEISVQDMLERCKKETGIDIINYCKEEPI